MTKSTELPKFIEPMHAQLSKPFDSDDHLFEIKWDGTRVLAFIDADRYRLVNRREVDITERFPEFACLQDLPAGTVLDGEVVVLKNGKPQFDLLQSRNHATSELKIRTSSRTMPATYVVFDQLYQDYEPIVQLPLRERREILEATIEPCRGERLMLSEGIEGSGKRYFEEAVRQDLEGVMAKRLASRYQPGQRTDDWLKIKRRSKILCAIVGFIPDGNDFRSLMLATNDDGGLRYCGKVGTGFTAKRRKQMNELLWDQLADKPLVECPEKGNWLQPGLYCKVSFSEQTKNGELRDPVFEELITE